MVALSIGFVSDLFGASSGLRDFLSQFDHAQKVAYQRANTCEDLRNFERKFKDGYYVSLAQKRTDNPRLTDQTVWAPAEQKLKEYITRDGMTPMRSEDAARQATQAKLSLRAQADCASAATQLGGRFKSAGFAPDSDGWVCSTLAAGTVCGVSATATCQIDAPSVVQQEDCSE